MITSKILRLPFNRRRLLLASVLGGLYSLTIFINISNVVFTLFIKLFLSSTIVLASFKTINIKHFFRCLGAFLGANFLFAGLMLALWITFKPKGMVFHNGTVYFNFNIAVLCVSVIACYVIISIVLKFLKRKAPQNKLYDATIEVLGKRVSAAALYDTGNTLQEGFTGSPVIVAQYDTIKSLLPQELYSFFDEKDLIECNIPEGWASRLRMIPFNSVKCKGLLPAFRPDKIIVKSNNDNEIIEKNVFVAVTKQSLSNGEYSILLNGLMLEKLGGKEHEKLHSHN